MARSGKPVVDGRADLAALERRVARAVMPGDQQHDALALVNRPLERAVDRAPGRVEVHSVQVDNAVRLDRTGAELSVPAGVEGARSRIPPGDGEGNRPRSGRWRGPTAGA